MIRSIEVNDTGLIIEMLYTLAEESPRYGQVRQDEAFVRVNLDHMVQQPGFIGVIDDELRGVMFGSASQNWYDPELRAYEQLLYILPEFRNGALAPRLIKEFERRARNLGCIAIHAGVTTQMQDERTFRLYERLGYTREGNAVTKRIK